MLMGLPMNLGRHVRRWGLAHALSDNDESLEIMLGERGIYVNLKNIPNL